MKKQLTALLTTALLLTSLTGCNRENISSENSTSSSLPEGTESGTSDLTQSSSDFVDIGNDMLLTGTPLETSQLEKFSIEPYVSDYVLSADEEKFLDSLDVPDIKNVYVASQVLYGFISSPQGITPTSAVTENNGTSAYISDTNNGNRYFESGYTYDSIDNVYSSTFTQEELKKLINNKHFIDYNGEMLYRNVFGSTDNRVVHSEYELVHQNRQFVQFRKTSFSYDSNSKPATEYKPELRYKYDITLTDYKFDLTENGWCARLPVVSKISGKTEEELKYIDVFDDTVFDTIVEITSENSWVTDAFMAEAEKNGETVINPDGSPLEPEKAVKATGNKDRVSILGFDFAYIFYTKPYCITGMNNYQTFEDYKAKMQPHNYSDMIKVKAGDVLDNGLKVKSAEYFQDIYSGRVSDYLEYCHSQSIKFEGEITLNGVLVYYSDSVYFVPDSTNDCCLPTFDAEPRILWHNDYGALSTTTIYKIRNIESLEKNFEYFEKNKIVEVKATIKDPILYADKHFAELVSYEIIDK